MNVYFISGLGADKRAFEKLRLSNQWNIHYIEWTTPFPDESLNHYAHRLSASINRSQPFILVGLSFGGMLAAAMNEFIEPRLTILISSIACSNELPWYFRLSGRLSLHKLIPGFMLSHPNKIGYWLFGAKSKTERKLLDKIMDLSNPHFIRWGFHAIVTWKNKQRPPNLFQLHGSNDKILPLKFTKSDMVIENGSHFMVWTRAAEVSKILEEIMVRFKA